MAVQDENAFAGLRELLPNPPPARKPKPLTMQDVASGIKQAAAELWERSPAITKQRAETNALITNALNQDIISVAEYAYLLEVCMQYNGTLVVPPAMAERLQQVKA